MSISGFYVPNSISGSYVANKRDEQGSFVYDTALNKTDIQKQKALQSLDEQYSQTINNAYASYLAANQSVLGSAMGEGYKEKYLQLQDEALRSNIAQANLSAASARMEIEESAEASKSEIGSAYQQEVANIDRAVKSMENYLVYLNSLSDEKGGTYLSDLYGVTPEKMSVATVDQLYSDLFNAQPQSYKDTNDTAGKSYVEWVKTQLGSGAEDLAWSKWFYGEGGYEDFRKATETVETESFVDMLARQKQEQKQVEAKLEEEKKQDINFYVGKAQRVKGQSSTEQIKYNYNGKTYKGSVVDASSTLAKKINRKLDISRQLKDKKLSIGDVIEYENNKYVIHQNVNGAITYIRLNK